MFLEILLFRNASYVNFKTTLRELCLRIALLNILFKGERSVNSVRLNLTLSLCQLLSVPGICSVSHVITACYI